MNVDFSQLTPPSMIEVLDYEVLLAERKEALIAKWETADEQDNIRAVLNRESEPLTKFLEENTYRELILRNRINQAALAVLLAFAQGDNLDAVAANFDVTRLVMVEATSNRAAVYESDDALRTRVQMKFDSLSTAGPENSYKYHCFSADARVSDVSVISPAPAYVTVSILQADSENNAASAELLEIVNAALSPEDVRPIGDRVTVQSAQMVNYTIDADIYVSKDPEGATLLDQATTNIQNYISTAKRIGRSIYLSAIYAQLHVSGVNRVVIRQPSQDIELTPEQASFCSSLKIQLVGTE